MEIGMIQQPPPPAPVSNGDHGHPHEDEPPVESYGREHPKVPVPAQILSGGNLNGGNLNGGSRNGGIPPPQVFQGVDEQGNIPGLEEQLQTLSIKQEPIVNGHANVNPEGEIEHDEGNDGIEAEDDPLKLFVGQVPKAMNEEDIFPTFDSFGPLKDVAIIRDKHTGLHRGCAFVTFWASADAERAEEALHDKYTFPGARRPAQVKPAEPSVPENKLFIGMLSRKAGEADVKEIFQPYGEIKEIYMIRNADGSSKCAAFLRYVKRESALQAIESLNNNVLMDGSARPLIVKFADNKHQKQQRQIRSIRRAELIALGGTGYPGYQVPQIPPPLGVATHPGGPQYPMPPPQYAGPYGAGAPPPHHPYMYPHPQYGQPYNFHPRQEMRPPNPRPREGPAGANLFVYHLPHDLTDADLATAFNPFGNVISAKVYVDRYTGESKGFGFVSYDSVMSAESAIEQMNGFQIGNKRLKVQHKRVHSHNGMQQAPQHPQQHVPPAAPPQANGAPLRVNP